MRTIHNYIRVEHNKHIREYVIYYYRNNSVSKDDPGILKLTIDTSASVFDVADKQFSSRHKFEEYLKDVYSRDKITSYNIKEIRNILDVFNSNDNYVGIEIKLPYFYEPYEESDIRTVYDIFVEKLHIELINE